MDIIVAIDLIDGELVRLTKGAYETKQVYSSDPVTIAKEVESAGLQHLHVVDLDGAKAGRPVNLSTIERIARETSLVVDVGGGIRSTEDLEQLFDAGAAVANLGAVAVNNPSLVHSWIAEYGPERFILAADSQDGLIKSGGWLDASSITLEAFIESYLAVGLVQVTATDINRDGMLSGPAVQLYRTLLGRYAELLLVASGGVSSLADLHELATLPLRGAIVGRALYEGRFTIADLGALQEELNG